MAKELGETSDAKELIPGDPEAVGSTAAWLKSYGDTLHSTGEGLKRIDTTDGWTGQAGDAFRAAFKGEPQKWLEAGDCFHDAATALTTYKSTLEWAQGQARDAIRQWGEAQAATAKAKTEHEAQEKSEGRKLPFTDPGDATRTTAENTLSSARSQLKTAGDTAADAVAKGRDKAPEEPGWLDKVGDFFSDAGDFLEDMGKTALADLESIGNAMVHDPGAVLEIAGGLGLATLGAGGEILGVGLDLTGVGAAIGIPVNVASAGVIATGLGMAGIGAAQIAQDAMGPDRVQMEGNGGGGGSSSPDMRTQPSRAADPNAKPEGRVTNIPKNADDTTRRAFTRENESADILAKNGYKVEQNPDVPGTTKNPDYRVEGEVMDCYAPTAKNPRSIATGIQKKVDEGQADRIVLNLSDSDVDVGAMRKQLNDWPIEGLKEVTVIDKSGNVVSLYP
ncbi:putative T7SS-secreted protein [Kitasatospora sp. NPDC001539]|uniref:putative T7SS-secreted protein n=1 Tax=Kitasatospora sp. NPDC001539 TaxID=3154384 RepID=UPI00332DF0B5